MEHRYPRTNLPALILIISLIFTACNAPAPSTGTATKAPATVQGSTAINTSLPVDGTTATSPVTDTPAAVTDTPNAAATETLTPGPDCYRIQFMDDVNFPDDTKVDAGKTITKTWRVKNSGTCPWDPTYRLVFVRGEQMEGDSPAEIFTAPVAAGSFTDVSIELTMPASNGVHKGIWQIVNADGDPLLKADGTVQELSIVIEVTNGTGGRVTSVRMKEYFYYGVKCTSNVEYDITMTIYSDGPATVAYTWSATSGVLTVVSGNHAFTGAGSTDVTTHISGPFADANNVRLTLTANGVSNSYTICP